MATVALGTAALPGELGVVGGLRRDLREDPGRRRRGELVEVPLAPAGVQRLRQDRVSPDHPMLATFSPHSWMIFLKSLKGCNEFFCFWLYRTEDALFKFELEK